MTDVFSILAIALVVLFLLFSVALASGFSLFRWVLGRDAHQLAEQINRNIDNALALASNPFVTCLDADCRVCQLRKEKNR